MVVGDVENSTGRQKCNAPVDFEKEKKKDNRLE